MFKTNKLSIKELNELIQESINTWDSRIDFKISRATATSTRKANIEDRSHSVESRLKMRLAHTGKVLPKETIAKLIIARTGKKRSKECCLKMSVANTGKKLSAEHKEKIRIAHLGKKQTPEHIAKRVSKQIGKKRSEEYKEKMRMMQTGVRYSDEVKLRMSKASTGRRCLESVKLKFSKEVSVCGIKYINAGYAALALGIKKHTVSNRINSKSDIFKDWFYVVNKGEGK